MADYRLNKVVNFLENNTIFDYEKISYRPLCCYGNTMYAVVGNTIKRSTDFAKNWTDLTCPLFTTMIITQTNVVYGFVSNVGAFTTVYISSDGILFTEINTSDINIGSVTAYGMSSNGSKVIFCESNSSMAPERDYARIFSITNNVVAEVFRVNTVYGDSEKIGHFHNVTYLGGATQYAEPNIWIATTGDHNNNVKWFISQDNGVTWLSVDGIKGQKYRTTNMNRVGESTLIWASDAVPSNTSAIYKCDLNDVINTTEEIQSLPLTSWGCSVYGKGLCVTVREGSSMLGSVFIYASEDNGKNWSIEKELPIRNAPVNHDQPGFHYIVGPDGEGSYYVNGVALRDVSSLKIKNKVKYKIR